MGSVLYVLKINECIFVYLYFLLRKLSIEFSLYIFSVYICLKIIVFIFNSDFNFPHNITFSFGAQIYFKNSLIFIDINIQNIDNLFYIKNNVFVSKLEEKASHFFSTQKVSCYNCQPYIFINTFIDRSILYPISGKFWLSHYFPFLSHFRPSPILLPIKSLNLYGDIYNNSISSNV